MIREAATGDRSAILAVVEAAFGGGGDASEELAIVTKSWERGCSPAGLELVAEAEDGRIVGHVLAALGSLDGRPEG